MTRALSVLPLRVSERNGRFERAMVAVDTGSADMAISPVPWFQKVSTFSSSPEAATSSEPLSLRPWTSSVVDP